MAQPQIVPSEILKDDVAIVTGAGKGIGQALAVGLAHAGAKLAICDVDSAALEETAAILRAEKLPAIHHCVDVRDLRACTDFLNVVEAQSGPVSVLVNNAAILSSVRIDDGAFLESWRATFSVNVDGTMNMIVAALPYLQKTRGRIVNVCSTSAFLASDGGAPYSASKGAIVQLTRALAVELGPKGIRVNAIAPGVTETPLAKDVIAASRDHYLERIPLKRIAMPDDMVGPLVFLASRQSSHVTGVILPVDGGYLATGVTRGRSRTAGPQT